MNPSTKRYWQCQKCLYNENPINELRCVECKDCSRSLPSPKINIDQINMARFLHKHGHCATENNHLLEETLEVGELIEFNSDVHDLDDPQSHTYVGTVTSINPHKCQITMKVDGAKHTYFIDELSMKPLNLLENGSVKNMIQCDYLKRLLDGLCYYQYLNVYENKSSQEPFVRFIHKQYQHVLDDYIHVITTHSHQIETIHNQFPKCFANKCDMTQRYYRHYSKNKLHGLDSKSIFYCEIYDSIHNYLFHLFDVGMRIKQNKYDEYQDQKQDIMHQQQESVFFLQERFTKLNKFNIQIDLDGNNETFTYSFMQRLLSIDDKITANAANNLYLFIRHHEYDSDAIIDDIGDFEEKTSNVLNIIHHDELLSLSIKDFITDFRLSNGSFASGFRFYYWECYKDLTQTQIQQMYNIDAHSCHDPDKNMYVRQKYETFKEEILEHISGGEYRFALMVKAEEYINTDRAKCMVYTGTDPLHYGVHKNTPISVWNLAALILYCNFGKLSTQFTESFRAMKLCETLSSIQERNREFWWWSKILRETVEYYGEKGTVEKGPFYCGMKRIMAVSEFGIRLCCPTSTSTCRTVAERFAGGEGIIIQLNNNGYKDAESLRVFDCSWISKYKEECERLMFGGRYQIRIQSIIINKNNKIQNFEEFFHAFFLFDCMCNGTKMNGVGDVTKNDVIIMESLVNQKINDIDVYVVKTFKLFCNQKRQIVINMHCLDKYFGEMHHLMLYKMKRTTRWGPIYDNFNVVHDGLFKLFKNMEHIIIYTTNDGGDVLYLFSLSLFFDIIIEWTSWKQIDIKAVCMNDEQNNNPKDSWISKYCSVPTFESIKQEYKKNDCQIFLKQKITQNTKGKWEDWLVIKRY